MFLSLCFCLSVFGKDRHLSCVCICVLLFFFNLTKNCPVALCNIGAFSISGSYARPVWVSVRSRNPDNLSAKYLGLKSVRTSLAHSEGAFSYTYLRWSPGVVMIAVSGGALSSDRPDTAEHKLKPNQIFRPRKGCGHGGGARCPSQSHLLTLWN